MIQRENRLRRMPAEVRRLREPWRSVAPDVPDLTPELERDFRFASRVTRTERGWLLGGTIKGGSSCMWLPATAAQHEAYLRWRRLEGFVDDEDRSAWEDLRALARAFSIEVVNGRVDGNDPAARNGFRPDLGRVYPLLVGVLKELPPAHLERPELARIQIGGYGPDAAKGSAYQDGTVYLYDFAVRGARRATAGLLLHELGHAHERALGAPARAELRGLHARLAHEDAFYGVEYILGAESRRTYQRMAFEEFVAETYLIYAACGAGLRAWIAELPPAAREAWKLVYALYRDTFGGFEYD